MKIGRNDPCPCGSGLKYKKCCANTVEIVSDTSVTSPVTNDLKQLLQGRSFGSLEEVNALLQQHMQKRSRTALEDFQGLSPEQMHRLLYSPFSSPQLVAFPEKLAVTPEAPIIKAFTLLAAGIGEDGLKPTATGNLPRQFCRDAARAYLGEEEYLHRSRHGELRTEDEFSELHVTRLVAEIGSSSK
ncbi:MAG: SEC-C metal-binding domain-containing protein [Desulfobacter sp.]